MKKNFIIVILIAAVVPFVTTGCFTVDKHFMKIRDNILSSMDGKFKTDVQFGIGAVMLGLGSTLASFSEEDKFAADIMTDIDNVMVGVYKRKSKSEINGSYALLKKLDKEMEKNGYIFLVKNRTADEMNAVYVSQESDLSLNEMFVISLNQNELVLVKVTGNLERAIASAVRQKGMNLEL